MKRINKKNSNPFNLCTLDENSACANCSVKGKAACKFDERIKNNFKSIGMPPVLVPMAGLALIGFILGTWWLLIAYAVYVIAMFSIFEIRFLCSHCPYYPDNNKTLVCLGNHGTPKLWKYHPEPMNKFEKFMMTYGVIGMIFFILPITCLGYGVTVIATNYAAYGLISLLTLSGFLVSSLLISLSFVNTLKTFYCSKCVNFSCPLNTVQKSVVDNYLRKNPVMREAWEKSGYVLDEESAA